MHDVGTATANQRPATGVLHALFTIVLVLEYVCVFADFTKLSKGKNP